MLQSSDEVPFDAHHPAGGDDPLAPDYGDWAARAARGIIVEYGNRGAEFNDAFHPERVAEDTWIEIIDVMAAIIREAFRQEQEAGSAANSQ
jgi:hypothetical protein